MILEKMYRTLRNSRNVVNAAVHLVTARCKSTTSYLLQTQLLNKGLTHLPASVTTRCDIFQDLPPVFSTFKRCMQSSAMLHTDGKETRFIFREATLADKDDILKIGDDNMFLGNDIVIDMFEDTFINSPYTTPYVVDYKGALVAFAAATIVDDGETLVIRDVRVRSDFRRRGVCRMLEEYMTQMCQTKREVGTLYNTHPALISRMKNKLVLERAFQRYDFPMSAFHLIKRDEPNIELETVTREHFHHYFTASNVKKYLFPDEHLLINWIPFKPLFSNLPIICMREEHAYRLTNVMVEKGCATGLLSISSSYRGAHGMMVYQIDVYGTDSSSLYSHIFSHINKIRHNSGQSEKVCVEVVGEKILYDPISEIFFEGFGSKKAAYKMYNMFDFATQCLFETVK